MSIGLFVSLDELKQLPAAGKAWDAMKAQADKAPGTVKLADQDNQEDVRVLARAFVYGKTGIQKYKDSVVSSCLKAINTENGGRTLALGRGLISYVVAADVVDLPSDIQNKFKNWLAQVIYENLDGQTLVSTSEVRPNNWMGAAMQSRLAVHKYLNQADGLEKCSKVFHGWLGARTIYAGFKYGNLDWQADPKNPVGINKVGTSIQGRSVDGALPEELRRSGGFKYPFPKENYCWEMLQFCMNIGIMLDRSGYDVWNWESDALLRAFSWLWNDAQFQPTGDDLGTTWTINKFYKQTYKTQSPITNAKSIGYQDWLYGI